MICPNNFAKEVARASGRKMPDVSDELMKNGFDSVKKGDEIKRINTQKFSSNKVENDNLNSLYNSSDEMLQMAAKAGEYEKVFKKEARGIHNVMNNGKKSTLIKRDLDSIDSAIKFERGFNNKNNKGYGAEHIIKHTISKDEKGYITDIELANLGKNIREYIKNHKEPFIDKNGARIYEWENSDGVRFRAVVGDIQGKAPTTAVGSKSGLALRERIITFYSDRNLNEPMNFKNPNLNKENGKNIEQEPTTQPMMNGFSTMAMQKAILHLGSGGIGGAMNANAEQDPNKKAEAFVKGFLLGAGGSVGAMKMLENSAKLAPQLAQVSQRLAKDLPMILNDRPDIVGKVLGRTPKENYNYIFGGENAIGANKAKLKTAREMAKNGADESQIWAKTGWYKDIDKKWKFEINPKGGELKENAISNHITKVKSIEKEISELEKIKDGWGNIEQRIEAGNKINELKKQKDKLQVNVGDILDDKMLFTSYPELKNIQVVFNNYDGGASYGGKIELSRALEPTMMKSVLYHELQHEIQIIERFANGGGYFADKTEVEELLKKYPNDADLKKLYDGLENDYIYEDAEFNVYNKLAGEAEARNVQARQAMLEKADKEAKKIVEMIKDPKKAMAISRDLANVDDYVKLASGNNTKGAIHINLRHTSDPKKLGYVTNDEISRLGENMRKFLLKHKEPYLKDNKFVYEWVENGNAYTLVTDSRSLQLAPFNHTGTPAKDEIITFYSNRNLKTNGAYKFTNPEMTWQNAILPNSQLPHPDKTLDIAPNDRIVKYDSYMSASYTPKQKEVRGVYNVLKNGKQSTRLYKDITADLNAVDNIVKFEKGKKDYRTKTGYKNGYGLEHIKKHLGADKNGYVTEQELLHIGDFMRSGKMSYIKEYKNGKERIKRVYESFDDEGTRFRVLVGENEKGDTTISFFSNRKAQVGFTHNAENYTNNLKGLRNNSTTTANKSQENILKGVDGKEYPNSIAGRWEKRVDEAFDWAYKNIYAKGVKSGIEVVGSISRMIGSQSGAKIQRGLEKAFALQDEIGALSRLKSAYHRNNQVARMEAMKVYESLVKLEIDERVALFRMLDGQEVEPNLAGKLRPTYQKLRDKIDERAEQLISLGMLKGENAKENYIKYSYSQYYGKNGVYSKGFGIGKLKARDENLSYEDRVQLGLIEDAAIAVTQTLNSQNSQIQKAILFKSLADEYAVVQPKDGYVKVSDESVGGGVKKYGALAGKYVPSAVYDDLQNAGLVSSIFDVIRPYTNVIDHIKVNLTVKNPATHGYNVLSNSVLAFLHGDLGANLKLMKLLASDKKGFNELLAKAEAMGLDTASDDIEMRNLLMANDEIAKEALKTKNPLGYYISKAWQNIYLTKNSATGKVARSAYAWEDKWFKLARFKKNLDMGMSDEAAFSDANSAYVDYSSHFNPTIKLLDKTGVLPFFHFAVKSSIVVTKAAIKNPAKFAMLQAALIGSGASSLPYWFDSEQKDADNSRLPDWASSNYLPNLFGVKNQVQIGESGLYFNAARAMAGFRLSSIDDITGGGGLIGGLLDILRGRDSWGNDMVGKHDPAIKQLTARLDAFSKQFLPSITLGRYGRQGLAIATGNNPKNAYDEPMGLGELAGRFMGLRMINEKKELRSAAINAKNRYKKAKEKGDDGAMVVALNDFMACKAAASDMGVSLEALMKMKKRDIK
ncbi:LPD23 domain-containing protein [Campylobacter sp. P091]|uniref:LPD23 domain-containing protein n=1 Tax=Campylobacter sp. P091 TaxID=1895621 RepID=UPI0015D7B1E6|nr:LPD23 domain-containing protein [Campylobacter sp. P091]